MKYIIASDFHIKYKENENDLNRRLKIEYFLKSQIGKIDGLILLGDIFDFWFEWGRVMIKNYFSILHIFTQLKQAGCRLIFVAGNHEFISGDFLQKTIGFEVYEDYHSLEVNGKKLFVSHGDIFTENDTRYKVFRKIVKSSFTQFIFKLLHPAIGLWIASILSRTDNKRPFPAEKKLSQLNGLINKATELSKEYDYIVFGHTHLPEKHEINNSIYINCGDWVSNESYCMITNEKIDIYK